MHLRGHALSFQQLALSKNSLPQTLTQQQNTAAMSFYMCCPYSGKTPDLYKSE